MNIWVIERQDKHDKPPIWIRIKMCDSRHEAESYIRRCAGNTISPYDFRIREYVPVEEPK